ncbi:MAG TPA: SMI1/KNR4 family protein [Candidatus Elarobacter sp.]
MKQIYNDLGDAYRNGNAEVNETLVPRLEYLQRSSNCVRDANVSNHIVSAVIAYWDAHDVRYLPGASSTKIRFFEQKYGVKLPPDMRCFYTTTNGTHVQWDTGQDHESYDFYPIDEIAPDSEFRWAITFADYRELSWWFATDLLGGGSFGSGAVYLLGAVGRTPLLVAHSFTEFLGLYLSKSPRLTPRGAKTYHESLIDKLR